MSINSENNSDSDFRSTTPLRKGRMGKPKVRTGCITCKVRRIKCDEAKPFCVRCTSTGRQCDGYRPKNKTDPVYGRKVISLAPLPTSFAIKFKFSNQIPNSLFDIPDTTSQELRALEFFRCVTANKFSEWMTENFWKHQIPQCGSYEPSVRHAIIACGTIHEQHSILCSAISGDPRLEPHALEAQSQFADRHYNSAISERLKLMAERPECLEIALINCLLLVLLSFVRGNFSTAVLHLHNGMEILNRGPMGLDFSMMPDGSLESNVVQVFHHLSFNTPPSEYHLSDTIPNFCHGPIFFTTLLEAEISLEGLLQQSLRLIRFCAVRSLDAHDLASQAALEYEIKEHMSRLDCWAKLIDMLLPSFGDNLQVQVEESAHELRIMHLLSLMWLGAGLECCTSLGAEERFNLIVDSSETLQSWRYHRGLPTSWTEFGRRLGGVPPLWFVATKCQNHVLRKKEVAILMEAYAYVCQEDRLSYLHETDDAYVPVLQMNYSRSRTNSETVVLREEKTAYDKRIAMEVEVEPNTPLVDLILTPGEYGRAWKVKRTSPHPSGPYFC